MSGTEDKNRAKRAPFTDAAFIPRDELPNLPKIYDRVSGEMIPSCGKRRINRLSLAAAITALCLLCFFAAELNEQMHTEKDIKAEDSASTATHFVPQQSVVPADPSSAAGDDVLRPYMGVIVQTVSPEVADYYNQYNLNSTVIGAQVYAVDEKGGAARAGIQKGDIITKLGGCEICSDADLSAAEKTFHPGESASVQIFRNGEYKEFPIIFSPPDPDPGEEAVYFRFREGW